eukprot:TRINITY_DN2850_c0_g1_i1.p1 TRINITY_DN2850_c0_g1~~TRINITY_DN2850_c0_g1_i1.p1  ORF type:complete len:1071 (+),score=302.50 TRINITY_DN2850_c0_g1_i1:110-3322(+)
MAYTQLPTDGTLPRPETERLGAISGLWRSEEMRLLDLKVDMPLVDKLLRTLGALGYAEFRDLSGECEGSEDVRKKAAEYKDRVRVCESIERRLRYFEDLYPRFPLWRVVRESQSQRDSWSHPAGAARTGGAVGWKPGGMGVPALERDGWEDEADTLNAVERHVEQEERALREQQIAGIDENVAEYCNLLEQMAVLGTLASGELAMDHRPRYGETPRVEQEARARWGDSPTGHPVHVQALRAPGGAAFGQLVGTIEAEKVSMFHRLVQRAGKGNAVLVTSDASQDWSMDLQQMHQRVLQHAAEHDGADARAPGALDILQELNEESRISTRLCSFLIYYSAPLVQTRLLRLCATWGKLHFAVPVQTSGGKSAEQACLDAGMEMLGNRQTPDGYAALIAQKQTTAREKLQMTVKLIDSVVHDLARIRSHQLDRRRYVLKEKAIYHTVGLLRMRSAEGAGELKVEAQLWVPARKMATVEAAIDSVLREGPGFSAEGDPAGVKEQPPTWFETNDFTSTFQGIVDSYGVPRYQETNPAVWTIITFPWLFAIMYGDVGHGIMVALGAVIMIALESRLKGRRLNEIVEMIFGARWLLLLMGLFATYLGFLYNDTFGLMLEYSPSRYKFPENWEHLYHVMPPWIDILGNNDTDFQKSWDGIVPPVCGDCPSGPGMQPSYRIRDIQEYDWLGNPMTVSALSCPYDFTEQSKHSCYTPTGWGQSNSPKPFAMMTPSDGPTPFGVDVAWSETENKLDFYNSFKMKNAVIVGVLQMIWGLILSLFNYVHRRDVKHILFGFVPEFIFLSCTFGYMGIMIVIKWTTEWPSTNIAPNTLETMTNFFLSPGHYPEFDEQKCWQPAPDNSTDCTGYALLYSGQKEVQVILVIIAFAVLPFMLIPIPYIEYRHKKRLEQSGTAEGLEEADRIDMQEVVIKQVIHVIEYVLGCVSNTASYLRLWALSLAHAELSDVFLKYTMLTFLEMDGTKNVAGGIFMYVGFGAWLSCTFGVLIVMEALSAFLHALRLHWVEFQNKFYVGDGRAFKPLCFRDVFADHGVPDAPPEEARWERQASAASGRQMDEVAAVL